MEVFQSVVRELCVLLGGNRLWRRRESGNARVAHRKEGGDLDQNRLDVAELGLPFCEALRMGWWAIEQGGAGWDRGVVGWRGGC